MTNREAQCTHKFIEAHPVLEEGGAFSDRWRCRTCKAPFVPAIAPAPPHECTEGPCAVCFGIVETAFQQLASDASASKFSTSAVIGSVHKVLIEMIGLTMGVDQAKAATILAETSFRIAESAARKIARLQQEN